MSKDLGKNSKQYLRSGTELTKLVNACNLTMYK